MGKRRGILSWVSVSGLKVLELVCRQKRWSQWRKSPEDSGECWKK